MKMRKNNEALSDSLQILFRREISQQIKCFFYQFECPKKDFEKEKKRKDFTPSEKGQKGGGKKKKQKEKKRK